VPPRRKNHRAGEQSPADHPHPSDPNPTAENRSLYRIGIDQWRRAMSRPVSPPR
jgi:hypothetical protein